MYKNCILLLPNMQFQEQVMHIFFLLTNLFQKNKK